jgi:hypothetical protein
VSVYIFVGPTLSVEEARSELDAIYLPPVAQADIYRIALHNPTAIGIIDGYFHRVPAVCHKEILWAMAQGVHIFGAASMGAIRAAELTSFGMEGVGAIFEAYQAGVLKDDDEVAVTHGPVEAGFRAHSEAMVNIRATLAAAKAHSIIRDSTRETLEFAAKESFYPNRIYPEILRRAKEHGASSEELNAFDAWVVGGRVDQKRADAIEMLRRMRAFLATRPTPKRAEFRLEHTLQWQRLTRFAGVVKIRADGAAETTRLGVLLDELGLQGDAYPNAYHAALLSHLALAEAQSNRYEADETDVRALRAHFCEARGLHRPDDVEEWLRENHLTDERFDLLLREEVKRARVFEKLEVEIVSQLPDHLRLVGHYSPILARAQQKSITLEALGLQHSGIEDLGLTAEALFEWHFNRLRRPTPDDIGSYARAHGFGTVGVFVRALLRDYCYVRSLELSPAPANILHISQTDDP